MAVWTQHTVPASAGGLGAEVRWYEVDPSSASLFQSGIVQSPDLYVFNGAISPDRLVNGSVTAFGRDMALGFNTSSDTTNVAIQMISKVGPAAPSAFVLVAQSAGPDIDATCVRSGLCRWGDFAGASPDPGASTGSRVGRVWFTGTYNQPSADDHGIDWLTWNWGATP
jgi:hypothetical protein